MYNSSKESNNIISKINILNKILNNQKEIAMW